MSGKCLSFALVVAMAWGAAGKDLALTSGGDRILDRDPLSSASNCSGWTFGPGPLVDEAGNVTAIYTTSDQLTNHCIGGIHSPERFGDRIRYHPRNANGTWSGGIDVIDRNNFSWMRDVAFLQQHPETFIGHLASPSVIKSGGRYYMAFVGSVDDRNLCAGEHYAGNICGSCFDPWSYFVVMWAVSDDGVSWRVKERGPGDAMLLGRAPDANDRYATSLYKGLTRVSMVEHEGHFYFGTQYWTRDAIKTVIFRIARDPSSQWGIVEDAEVWSSSRRQWVEMPAGRIPESFAITAETSVHLASAFSSISRTNILGADGFVMLTMFGAFPTGGRSRFSQIAYYYSTDLTQWSGGDVIPSAVPFVADGYSYEASMIDPVVVDDRGKLRLFFASGDSDHDGRHDCFIDPNAGPTAPYVGTGIFEATLEYIDRRPTRITLEVPRTVLVAGELARYIVTVTADGSVPLGSVVVVDSAGMFKEAPLVNGRAVVELPVRAGDTNRFVYAYYATDGIWEWSRSETIPVTVVERGRRRAVR